jgi:hypothetical protein
MSAEKKHTVKAPAKKTKAVIATKKIVAAKSSLFSKKVKKANKLLVKATLIAS